MTKQKKSQQNKTEKRKRKKTVFYRVFCDWSEWCVCKRCWENLASAKRRRECVDISQDNLPTTRMPIRINFSVFINKLLFSLSYFKIQMIRWFIQQHFRNEINVNCKIEVKSKKLQTIQETKRIKKRNDSIQQFKTRNSNELRNEWNESRIEMNQETKFKRIKKWNETRIETIEATKRIKNSNESRDEIQEIEMNQEFTWIKKRNWNDSRNDMNQELKQIKKRNWNWEWWHWNDSKNEFKRFKNWNESRNEIYTKDKIETNQETNDETANLQRSGCANNALKRNKH